MNFAMWQKALKAIPSVSIEEWRNLDLVSKWLISNRAAVLVMTPFFGILAGPPAIRDNQVQPLPWIVLIWGLIMAHAGNNLFNDQTDYVRGVDQKNYYRAMDGPRPLVDRLMTRTQNLTYFAFSAVLALVSGLYFSVPNPQFVPAILQRGMGGWPFYFASLAFWYNRSFCTFFVLGLIVDVPIRIFLPEFRR